MSSYTMNLKTLISVRIISLLSPLLQKETAKLTLDHLITILILLVKIITCKIFIHIDLLSFNLNKMK